MRLKSMTGGGGPTLVEPVDASVTGDRRGIEVEADAERCRVNALRSARGTAAAPPRDQKCSCDGGGWIVTLDRNRYKAPGTAEVVRFTRCICLDDAPGPARSGGARCRVGRALRDRGLAALNRRLRENLTRRFGQKVALDDVQFDV